MEKFVIEGGVPLSGTVVPAGNKNAALPLLACALLTDEDVVLHNVPHIRDTEALLDLLADLGVTVERPEPNTVKLNAANVHKTRRGLGSRRAHPRLVPGRRPAARPLRRGDDAPAGRRRDRPPPARSPPRRLQGARRDGRARQRHRHQGARRRPAPVRLLHGRAVRDGYRERADGRRRDRRHDRSSATPPASRTCRTSRGCSTRWARRSRASAPTSCTVHGVAKLGGCEYTVSPGPHRDRVVHGAGGRDRRRAEHRGLRRRGPADDPDGLPPPRPGFLDARGRHLPRPGRADAARAARRRRLPVQGRRRPVAGVPGRPHVDRRRAGHAVRGLRPDLREDVREPAVLRGQADLDGRRDHDLRPAPGDRHRPAPAARRAGLPARTSAPAWRC